MNRIGWLSLTILLGMGLACSGGAVDPRPSPSPTAVGTADISAEPFTDQHFHITLPDWPIGSMTDEATLASVTQAGQTVALARHEAVPRMLGEHLANILPGNGPFSNIQLDVTRPDQVVLTADVGGEIPQQIIFHLRYCDGFTYQITGGGPISTSAELNSTVRSVVNSAVCTNTPQRPPNQAGLVGLVISPANEDFSYANWRTAIIQAREVGVQASHTYLRWGDIESEPGIYDWTFTDYLIDSLWLEGLRLSAVIDFIHTSLPGSRPSDLIGLPFDDPFLQERATTFALAVANRYSSQIDYLALGNEANIYLGMAPEAVEPYHQFWQGMKTVLMSVFPNLPIGVTLAFHEAQQSGRFDLIETFKESDFLAYTYYPHTNLFRYDEHTPQNFSAVVAEMTAVSGNTPYIIVENGWATADLLGGSEQLQANYVQATFEALTIHQANIGRHIWYGHHDGQACQEAALSFVEPGFDVNSAGEAWPAFEAYLCSLGLRRVDGSPKIGWSRFEEEISRYQSTE